MITKHTVSGYQLEDLDIILGVAKNNLLDSTVVDIFDICAPEWWRSSCDTIIHMEESWSDKLKSHPDLLRAFDRIWTLLSEPGQEKIFIFATE